MNSALLTGIMLSAIAGIGTIIVQMRNQKFVDGDAAREAQEETQRFAEQVLAPDETLVLADYSPSMKAHVVLSDKGIHHKQETKKGEVRFDIAYTDIEKCKYCNASNSKVSPDGNVMHIEIKTKSGKYYLSFFLKEKEIAQELAKRGFENHSLF